MNTAPDALSPKQQRAFDLALQGLSVGEVAKRCQVTRQTVNEWRNQNMVFMEALQNQRERLREYQMDRMNALVDEGLEVLHGALRRENENTRHLISQSNDIFLFKALG